MIVAGPTNGIAHLIDKRQMRCETCKWWEVSWSDNGSDWGYCELLSDADRSELHFDNGDWVNIHTAEDFGCVLHEARDDDQ